MESEYTKYQDRGICIAVILFGTAIKYTSLLGGIYSVCKDEQDFKIATFAGVGYLIGKTLQGWGIDINNNKKLNNLEKTLKEK